ncbi:PAS-domain containing protein [Breoghania sp.]|uniref:sensor histidine kinase n=1 Tax=Breoghania sp. TaxID=2065378 RepID=UPI002AA79C2F|nr:PAS-domain containing protein [Breoghania sp.]
MLSGHYIRGDTDEHFLFAALLSSMHQGVGLMDQNQEVLVFSHKAKELFDLPEGVFQRDPNLRDILKYFAERGDYGPCDPEDQADKVIARSVKSGVHSFDRAMQDGRFLQIQTTELPTGGHVMVYSDVTAMREVEQRLTASQDELIDKLSARTQELEENREVLSCAINAIPDALVMVDAEGRLKLANAVMREIYPEIETHLDNNSLVMEAFPVNFGTAEDLGECIERINTDGERRMFGSWYRIRVSDLATGGIIIVFTDITDLKKQNEKLRAHTDQLVKHLRKEKRLNEMQRQFVSMASHEFRTPLAIIDGAAQRLKRRFERLTPDEVRERIGHIREAVLRINYLIERFIDFSVSQEGNLEIDPHDCEILPVLRAICEREGQAHKSHRITLTESIGDLTLNFDRRMIEQCLVNLIGNAVKYSPGQEEVLVDASVDGKSLRIDVTDFGVGIPRNEVKKVFGRFFRASTSSGIPGTGIGLNLTEMIVARHKGRISIRSEVGKGSTVSLRLPVITAESAGGKQDSVGPVEAVE